ncbi:hypothetical protein D3C87_1420650 [compost metagenome]
MVIGLTAEPLCQHPVKGKPLRRDMDKRQTRALTQAIPVSNKLEHRQIGGKPDIIRGKAFFTKQADNLGYGFIRNR